MVVYGVALLSACLIVGMLIGEALGVWLQVEANVGGVGIAMLFLVFASNSSRFKSLVEGVYFVGLEVSDEDSRKVGARLACPRCSYA